MVKFLDCSKSKQKIFINHLNKKNAFLKKRFSRQSCNIGWRSNGGLSQNKEWGIGSNGKSAHLGLLLYNLIRYNQSKIHPCITVLSF